MGSKKNFFWVNFFFFLCYGSLKLWLNAHKNQGGIMPGFGTWAIILEIMVLDHKIFFIFFLFFFVFFLCLKKMMLHLPNHLSPISHSPQSYIPTNKQTCPQLNLNHLPLGCQPCMLPLSHTLPSEETSILPYKYQRYSFQNWNLSICIKVITFFASKHMIVYSQYS